MTARQRQKANRRHRKRIAAGWSTDDADTCREAELTADAYIAPDVILGRPSRTEEEVLLEIRRKRLAKGIT